MAEAGSVAPVFRDGGYDATATYDFYHAVVHNNKLYFCRQDGTIGHEPQETSDEYWFLSLDGTFADAVTLNGKTESELSVANSEKLGGKGANEYALIETLTKMGLKDPKLSATKWSEIQKTWKLETTFFTAWGDGGGEMPTDWGGGIIIPSLDMSCKFIVYVSMISNVPYRICLGYMKFSSETAYTIQWIENATTADLANYLPLSGGDITGNAYVKRSGAESAQFGVENGVSGIYFGVNKYGELYIQTPTENIVVCGADGTKTFHGTATGNLPLDGGGTIKKSGYDVVQIENTSLFNSYVLFKGTNGLCGGLGFRNVDAPTFLNSEQNVLYDILHTGNKPSGTYTGNGSATARTIATGGIGKALLIEGNTGTCLVFGMGGAIGVRGGDIKNYGATIADYANGVLTLATTEDMLNASGVTYKWQVL